MKFVEILEKVKSLNLPKGQYTLFGSAPIVVRGIRPFSHDIDIIVTRKLWDEYLNKEGWVKKSAHDTSYLEWEGNNIEFWLDWGPGKWDEEKLIEESEIINDLPYVKLEEVLKWKKLNGREKDINDVKSIENYLKEKTAQ